MRGRILRLMPSTARARALGVLATVLGAAVFLHGCSSRQPQAGAVAAHEGEVAQGFEGEADPATMKLDMKSWTWVRARYKDGREVLPRQASAFTLTFGPEGKFSATTDCNRVGGTYAATGDRLTFSDVFATKMYCEGAQEGEFTSMLNRVAGYRFTSRGQLILDIEAGSGSAEFR